MKKRFAILASAAVAVSVGHLKAFTYQYDVILTSPVATEWTEDPDGGIWHANAASSADHNQVFSTNGLIMCTGDQRTVGIGSWYGPYASVDLLSGAAPTVGSDPGNYGPGFDLASRTPDVIAKTSYLVDQMDNTLVLPTLLLGHSADDWIECKADALTGAIHQVWSGVNYAPEPDPGDEWEIAYKTSYYNAYMNAIAGVNASNYTSSQALWLVGENNQVLFSKWSVTHPADPTLVPESSTSLGLMVMGLMGALVRRRGRA